MPLALALLNKGDIIRRRFAFGLVDSLYRLSVPRMCNAVLSQQFTVPAELETIGQRQPQERCKKGFLIFKGFLGSESPFLSEAWRICEYILVAIPHRLFYKPESVEASKLTLKR